MHWSVIAVRRAALSAVIGGILAGSSALAGDTANGAKNFRTPATVPNYFSNEAGPMIGGTAESQRGPLYPSQTASLPPRQQESVAPPAYRVETRRIRTRHVVVLGRGRRYTVTRTTYQHRYAATRTRSTAHMHVATSRHKASAVHTRRAAENRAIHVSSTHHRLHG